MLNGLIPATCLGNFGNQDIGCLMSNWRQDIKGDQAEVIVTEEDFFELTELVKSLQRAAGNPACFRTAPDFCDRLDCPWRTLCLKQPDDAEKT